MTEIILCKECSGRGYIPTGSVSYLNSNKGTMRMKECPKCKKTGRIIVTTTREAFNYTPELV